MNRKRVCVIYTGGTIGMFPTENGYAPKKGFFAQAMGEISDLKSTRMPQWELIEFDPLLDSSNIAVSQWNQIGRAIWENYNSYDGFVILHGTDTMAYTASALSFMLEGLSKPVVITGSQIPLSQLRSDGFDNIITSIMIAGQDRVKEVCLYFGGKLIRGNRATKSSADGLIAFDSPNYPYLAEAGIDIEYNDTVLYKSEEKSQLNLVELKQTSIGVLKIFPGIQFSLFESIMTERLQGIVLETFGTGNIPSTDNELPHIIEKAFNHGTIVTVCSQCQSGTVRLGAYETSSALSKAGAVSGFNMTTEAAVAKLYYLFSLGLSRDRIKELMEEDMRGELSK
ncbi:MAG: asparaginase [Eubacteriaceae bacterium]|nr:asparaginase [Eubacteriaceae bacterium]